MKIAPPLAEEAPPVARACAVLAKVARGVSRVTCHVSRAASEHYDGLLQVSSRKSAWAALSVDRKIQLLWQMHDIMRSIDHQQWARDSCAAALIPDDESKELNVALDMVIAVRPLKLMPNIVLTIPKVVNTTVIAKDIETLISVLTDMNRSTGATAPVATRTINDGKQTIASVMPFSSADKMGPYKDWKAEVRAA